MNNDVLQEILLRLPVLSLLRCRAVCKTWGNIIDSKPFRKLHTHNNYINNKSDDMVHLQLTDSRGEYKVRLQVIFHNGGNRVKKKLSIKLECDWEPQLAHEFDLSSRLVDAVRGLICMHHESNFMVPIAICNPFLGELKLLPPSNSSCDFVWQRDVAIGFDEDYKVVQLLSCDQHKYLHAQIYSKSTDSWRDLGDIFIDDVKFYAVYPIKSACKNGYFVHWLGDANEVGGDGVSKILSFDMKNEVFRAITLPEEDYAHVYYDADTRPLCHIFAEDEHSFRLFDFSIYGSDNLVRIYDSRCEGSELSWNHVMNVHVPLSISEIEVPLCRTSCVFFMHKSDESVCVYDYRARKFISRYSLPDFKPYYYDVVCSDKIIEYKGSLVSLEN